MMRLRQLSITVAVASLFFQISPTAQEPSSHVRAPAKGDMVVVKGCLEGPSLQSTETVTTDETGRVSSPVTYQLKGDKALLKRLRNEHDGQVVEVTGILKSALPQDNAIRGKKIGRTSITLGVGTPTSQPGAPSLASALPVLEARSFEGSGARCRR